MFKLPEKKIGSAARKKRTPEQKRKQEIWLYFGASVVVVAISLGFYTAPKSMELAETKTKIFETQESILLLEQDIAEAEEQRRKEQEELNDFRDVFGPQLRSILPEKENINELTRFFEDYATRLSRNGVMNLDTISYDKSEALEEYDVLPVQLSFESSLRNFGSFMDRIKKSGSIQKNLYGSAAVRLMSIQSIDVIISDFEKIDPDDKEAFDLAVSLEINAYYRDKSRKRQNKEDTKK